MRTMNPETLLRRARERAAEDTRRHAELIRRLREKVDPKNPNCIYREMLVEAEMEKPR